MCGRPKGTKNTVFHKWTSEEKDFIKENVKGITLKDLTKRFNEKFGTNLTVNQVKGFKTRHRLTSGTVNITPHNKGKKGVYFKGCEKTWFKKGNRPANYRPVGSERITRDGYIEVKVSDPAIWKLKHRLKYEEYYGAIPRGYVIIFADRNKNNFSKDNLIAISRKQLSVMNKNDLIKDSADLTQIGINIADILINISEKKG